MYKSNHISLCVRIYSIDVRHMGIDYGYPQGHAHKHCKKLQNMKKTCKIMFFFHLINMPCNPHAAGQCATHMCQKFCLVRNHL